MKFEGLSAVHHHFLGDRFVFHWKLKFIGLDGSGLSGADACLYQFSFVCFEYVSFSDHVVEFACFYAVTKNKKVSVVDESAKQENYDGKGDDDRLFWFHKIELAA